jgi:hypothetical protein
LQPGIRDAVAQRLEPPNLTRLDRCLCSGRYGVNENRILGEIVGQDSFFGFKKPNRRGDILLPFLLGASRSAAL